MKFSSFLFSVLALFFILAPSDANAQGGNWYHNGSIMRVDQDGPHVTMRYLYPRTGMQQAGAERGDVVLEVNIWSDDNVQGYAYVFKNGCQPAPYSVRGFIRGDNYIQVQGAAPVFAAHSCAVIGYRWNHNSNLIFAFR